ncbi:MAG: hypothetical protein JNM71_16320 [Flavobacterium lindanitolerans]|mgnify:FL=1|jgi:hypothetical protein|uniref:hypothetical protein n=1 Tax=Flavobacterium lindanitolerans TaxID=428988 RepID=UPI001A4FE24B|nr:hypothetical protein [Flavobacterium lindanitolerans]MBL7869580.1 hypothetical protein [Flavobacterium lindanitolerans]
MFLIVSRYLIPKGYRGITLFPFVILKNPLDRQNRVLVNHEKIHIRQQLEFLIIPFFLWYFVEYMIRLIQYKNKNIAYRNISFEKEAYSREFDLDYLKNRKVWDFRKYL